jgi:hypothetical protein
MAATVIASIIFFIALSPLEFAAHGALGERHLCVFFRGGFIALFKLSGYELLSISKRYH